MALPRESSFMPAIKCSSCGLDVEISMMGEHVCGGPGAERKLFTLTQTPSQNQAHIMYSIGATRSSRQPGLI